MSLTSIDPMKHLIRETSVAKVFRRQLRFPDIITFWSIETGQKRKIVEEMEDLGAVFELVTPDLLQTITACWRPVDWKVKKHRILSKEADRVRRENDDLIEDQTRWDWAQKRLKAQGKAPIPFAFGTPIKGGRVV